MAAGTYTVATEPVQARVYENRKGGGNLVVWRLGLENAESSAPDKLFELHKKEGNDPPAPGEQIEVERTQAGEFDGTPFTRLYLAYSDRGSAGASRGGGEGPGLSWQNKPHNRSAEHPRNEARVIHTSAISAAVPYINQMVALGILERPEDEDAYWKLVSRVATRLARSYDNVLDQEPQQTLGQEVPADTEGLR